ncbi:MAG: hypothetical protein ACP5OJ_07320 [Methanothermobacter sp.]
MIEVKDKSTFAFGLLLLFLMTWITILGYSPTLYMVIGWLLSGLFLIFSSIKCETTRLSLGFGILALIITFIWTITYHLPLYSLNVISGIVFGVIALLFGVITHYGILNQ